MDTDSMDHVAIPTIETEEPLVEVMPKLSKYAFFVDLVMGV